MSETTMPYDFARPFVDSSQLPTYVVTDVEEARLYGKDYGIFVIREGEKEGAVQTSALPSGDIAVTCHITVNDGVKTICSSFAGTTFNWTYKN